MKPNTFSVIVRIWNDEEEPYYEKNDKQYSFDSLYSDILCQCMETIRILQII